MRNAYVRFLGIAEPVESVPTSELCVSCFEIRFAFFKIVTGLYYHEMEGVCLKTQ